LAGTTCAFAKLKQVGDTPYDNTGAPGDASTNNCGPVSGAIWYRWTPTVANPLLRLFVATGATRLGIFDSCGGSQVFCFTCPSTFPQCGTYLQDFVTAGNEYIIVLGSNSASATTSGTLAITN
jgi:hypothetical protein